MLFNKSISCAILLLPLSLGTTYCFSAPMSSCERLKEYYNKSNQDIEKDLNEKKEKLFDAEEFSVRCLNESFKKFSISNQEEKTTEEVNEDEMKASAQRVRNAVDRIREADARKEMSDKLNNFNFAVGIGALYLANTPDIMSTTIDSGVLRTTTEEKYKLGLWLSTNSFIGRFIPGVIDDTRWGIFTAVQLGGNGGNEILNSFAAGFSFAADPTIARAPKGSTALVFQIGYGLTHIQTYANGYSDGMNIPTGTNQPVMKKTIGKGPALIVSTAF